jgi:two-component system NarL family response regulator
LKILVADDYEPFRKFVCAYLHRCTDVETLEVSDGEAAIEQAGALQPDLILLDIGLPDVHGIDVARRIPAVAPQSRVLIVSLEQAPDVIAETLHSGAYGYVHKLRCEDDLMPAIESTLAGKRFVSSPLALRHRGRHEVMFFSDDATLVDGFARFAAARLGIGDAAIVLATEPHRIGVVQRPARVGRRRRWRAARRDVRGARRRLDARDDHGGRRPRPRALLAGLRGLIGAAVNATGRQNARVAICGECVAMLCQHGDLDAALSIEDAGNDLVKVDAVDILCAYPSPRWQDDDPMFSCVCAKHTAVRCL